MKQHISIKARLLVIALSFLLVTVDAAPALATAQGTEGDEMQVAQADQLVLQLGTAWAGVEFELRTDAGLFPVPVVVDESGILTMDLGGSKTYTLSCLDSQTEIPSPEESRAPNNGSPRIPAVVGGVPVRHLVLFVLGLGGAITVLIVMRLRKRHRDSSYEDDYDDEEYL